MTKYKCWHGDMTEDEGRVVVATYAGDAAEIYVNRVEDSRVEYPVAAGRESMLVHVRDMETEEKSRYEVTGETVPHYRSEKR